MNTNINDTTPAAPSGKVNVTWQKDGSGNVSASYAVGIGIQMYRTASWSSANGGDVLFSPDTVDYDAGGGTLWNVSQPTRFKAPTAGRWTMRAIFYSAGSWNIAAVSFRINGAATVYRGQSMISGANTFMSIQASRTFNLSANDYVEADLYTSNPISMDVGSAGSNVTWWKESW